MDGNVNNPMLLHEYPYDHPDRNRPLKGCFYRYINTKSWREVLPSYAIADKTYNDLTKAWVGNSEFSFIGDRK